MKKIVAQSLKPWARFIIRQMFLILIIVPIFVFFYFLIFAPNGLYSIIYKPDDRVLPSILSKQESLGYLNTIKAADLKNGQQNTKKHRLVICGITRDNAKELLKIIPYIEQTGGLFKDYRIIMFENDSQDDTKKILKQWQSLNKKVRVESKDYSTHKRPNIEFLANARNQYLKILHNNPEYQDFDILMVVDLDMDYGWDLRGILHTFSHINEWEGVCSNGIFNHFGTMYDGFAFRKISPPPATIRNPKYWIAHLHREQKSYSPLLGLIPVHSCFGGLAFYKKAYIETCRYESIDGDCEHIPFHACLIANQGRMLMNAAQVIRYSHYY